MKVLFAKTLEEAKIPCKRDEDAGFDIYACYGEDKVVIPEHETIMLRTGICSVFEIGYVAMLQERGSTGCMGIGQRAGIIDSGFRGEWMIPITNHNDIPLIIADEDYIGYDEYILYPKTKAICQAVFLKLPEVEVEEVGVDEIKNSVSLRGEGKLGSSNK